MTPEPAFEEPWHAQLFALTVHLNEAGHFEWSQWGERFGATLKKYGLVKELNGGSDYFDAWLETLEGFLSEMGMAQTGEVATLREAWKTAYLATPHGHPVRLKQE